MKEDALYDVWTYDGMKKVAVCKEDYTYITSFFGTGTITYYASSL